MCFFWALVKAIVSMLRTPSGSRGLRKAVVSAHMKDVFQS